ncbi:MAG: efflux RND transporter permease subunit [Dethiobacter sp.]|nr:efflux RND transporter permease subunit [Dethiobacter sp.]MCL5982876.1 efflux RND transporter permease subunit [Bacillota bacterium]
MSLPALALKRPVAVLMAVCIVLVLGAFSFINLPVDLLPEMNFPMMAVFAAYEGASPEEVEAMVTRPLEEVLATVPGIERLTSTSSQGAATVMLEFAWGADLDFRALEVREKIDLVKGLLPDEVQTPTVFQFDPALMPILWLSVTGEADPAELKRLAEEVVKPRLERIEGVASAAVTGGVEREIRILADPSRLAHHGMTLEQLGQVLRMENLNVSAGRLAEGARELQVRSLGEFGGVADLETLVLRATPVGTLYLRDVAEIRDGFTEELQLTRLNGKPGISVAIYKQSGANTVSVSAAVNRTLQELEGDLPTGASIGTIFDQAAFINQSVGNMLNMALSGGLLALLVLYFFLRNLRSTLVIGLAMPVSIIATFVLMYFNGLTLNLVTLGGLALGIGMMVDNAIVILENVFRFRQQGLGGKEAAIVGSNEVADAIVAATLTTVVVFLPVVFVEGLASQIFSSMAWTISFALLASLAVALSVVPLLSSKLLKVSDSGTGAGAARFFDRVDAFYGRTLRLALGRRKLVIGVMVASFMGCLALVPLVGTEFIPGMDDNWLMVNVRLPDGASLAETKQLALRLEGQLMQVEEVRDTFVTIGASSGMGNAGAQRNRATLEVRLKERGERSLDNSQTADKIRALTGTVAGAEIRVRPSQNMSLGGGGAPVDILLKGDSLPVLQQLAAEVKAIVAQVEGTREVATSFDRAWPELQVRVDRERAASLGIPSASVSSTLRTALGGQVVTRLRGGGREVDVRLQVPEALRDSVAGLQSLEVVSPAGLRVPLGEVADFRPAVGAVSIARHDQVRSAGVTAQLSGRPLGPVVADIQQGLDRLALPAGYSVEFAGEQQQMAESFASLAMALVLAVLLVYMIMAAQFESLLHPFIIMFALPPTFVGVVLSLAITGRTLNVPAFIGVIMLAGIVVNNAIVLVDYINKLRERGHSCREAILLAGPVRLRPILMTTLTTVLGMLPMALGIGTGAEMQAPLATAVIGGLSVSTLLTLLVVPVIYSILDDLGERLRSKRHKTVMGEAGL